MRKLSCRFNLAALWTGLQAVALALTLVSPAGAQRDGRQSKPAVHATFELDAVDGSPFPSDIWTVSESRNRTGRKVNLPIPDCTTRPSDCNDFAVVNTMDGFNLMPRISVPFDGDIDPESVSSKSIYIVELAQEGELTIVANRVGINQVVWDPETTTLHVESDQVLRQTARYAVIVTNGIRDMSGRPVQASDAFDDFRHDLNYGQTKSKELKEYRKALITTLAAVERLGVSKRDVVALSVFTTQSATATLENVRDYLKGSPPPLPANFAISSGGSRAVYAVSSIQSISFRQHTGTNTFVNATVPLAALNAFGSGVVGTLAYGTYVAPQYVDHNATMTPHGTLEMPAQYGEATIVFEVFVPSGTKPAGGWPVIFLGHGSNTNIHVAAVWNHAASHAINGFASVAINTIGRGLGPLGTLSVLRTDATTVQVPAGGRALDQNGDGLIVTQEGATATPPNLLIGQRDAIRQAVIDYMQLVRVIQRGVDIDGDGTSDLDASNMAFFGNAFAVGYGTMFLAIEPDVRLGALSSPGGLPGRPDLLSFRPSGRGQFTGPYLAARTPSLLNEAYGLTSYGGIPTAPPFYNDNIPLRDQPALTNTIPGAMAIQEHFERIEWSQASSDAVAYAPHLEFDPLPGVPTKSVVILFGKGDLTAPNPRSSAMVRAGVLREKTIFCRNDLAFAEDPTVNKDPHTFLQPIAGTSISAQVGRGGQMAYGQFLASGGTTINHPEPARFWEFPIPVLPEVFSYIP